MYIAESFGIVVIDVTVIPHHIRTDHVVKGGIVEKLFGSLNIYGAIHLGKVRLLNREAPSNLPGRGDLKNKAGIATCKASKKSPNPLNPGSELVSFPHV
jgi:hypothetical protein